MWPPSASKSAISVARLGVDYEKEDIEDSRPTQKIDL